MEWALAISLAPATPVLVEWQAGETADPNNHESAVCDQVVIRSYRRYTHNAMEGHPDRRGWTRPQATHGRSAATTPIWFFGV